MEGEYGSGKILILQKLEMVTNAPFLDEIYHSGNSDGNGEWMRGDMEPETLNIYSRFK